jgi:hypothetical protein
MLLRRRLAITTVEKTNKLDLEVRLKIKQNKYKKSPGEDD